MTIIREGNRLVESSTGSTREEAGCFSVLHLRGSPYERGLAHGRLMKREILASGIAAYYGDFLKVIIFSRSFFRFFPGKARRFLFSLIESLLYSPLVRRISRDTKDELKGISDGTGIDYSIILRAALAPDIMELLISGLLRGGKRGNGNYYLGGCSAAFATGKALKSGTGSILARNLDFPGALVWKHPVIIYSHPTERIEVPVRNKDGQWVLGEKVKQPYMYLSVAGFPGTGLTGLNRAGIAMSTFICISRESSRRETPSLDYNHRIFTALEDLEALPFLLEKEGNRSATPHVLLLADENKAQTLEVSSKRSFLREMTPHFDTLIQTNHFFGPPMKKGEMTFTLERESTLERFRFIRDALELSFGKLDAAEMVRIISSSYNRFSGKIDLSGSPSPAQPDTLMSVLIEPGSGNFWVAEGRPPGICFNGYRGFNSRSGLEISDTGETPPSIKASEFTIFNEKVPANPGSLAMKSLRYYILAGEQMKTGKEKRAIRLLEKAVALYEDPGYHYTLAILYIRDNRPEQALILLGKIKVRFRYTPVRDSLIPLWEGRCHDLAGRRDTAISCYRRGLAIPGLIDDFAEAYRRGLKRKFTPGQLPPTVNFNNPGSVKL